MPAAIVAVYQLPGSNAIDAARARAEALDGRAEEALPGRCRLHASPSTPRCRSRRDAGNLITLLEALLLVVLVVYRFPAGLARHADSAAGRAGFADRHVRAFPAASGFLINTLSLFGLVLAIGLVVDDAIVVVEAVERHIEEGMTPKEAAFKAMEKSRARWSASR